MNRKYQFLGLTIALAGVVTVFGFITVTEPPKTKQINSGTGFAVVELFTSEGCSSCPAADEAIEKLLKKNTASVYILSYHVDYWDRLGWTDPFSQRAYADRQNQYANALHLNSVYTPQVIVNGSSEFVGSDEAQLTGSVQSNLNKNTSEQINIQAERNKKEISVRYLITSTNTVLLNLALVQPEATVAVKKGENGGKTLHHVNIVRILTTIETKDKGTATILIPADLADAALELIAFTQDKKSFEIRSVNKKDL